MDRTTIILLVAKKEKASIRIRVYRISQKILFINKSVTKLFTFSNEFIPFQLIKCGIKCKNISENQILIHSYN